jgi:hypothetical protein
VGVDLAMTGSLLRLRLRRAVLSVKASALMPTLTPTGDRRPRDSHGVRPVVVPGARLPVQPGMVWPPRCSWMKATEHLRSPIFGGLR